MTPDNRLTQGFISRHPEEAARVLERMPAAMSASFIASLDTKAAVQLLAVMVRPFAAHCLESMEPDQAASMLDQALPDDASNLLQAMSLQAQQNCLAQLPASKRKNLGRRMKSPEGSVGSKMRSQFFMLPQNVTVAEALRRIKYAGQYKIHDIYVTDNANRLVGSVRIEKLLRASAKQQVQALMKKNIAAIAARSLLSDAAEMTAWKYQRELPVVENRGALVGVLDYASVQFDEEEESIDKVDEIALSAPLELIWLRLADLIVMILDLLFSRQHRERGNK